MKQIPISGGQTRRPRIYRDHGKRLIDVALAALLIIGFSPVMLLCALAIRWSMGRPILFPQRRTGYGGEIFTIHKFRTMRPPLSPDGRPLSDSERITPLGNTLRRLHFDEIPQLINILRGDMSLIGPRPLLPQYLDRYTPRQARRHEVRPGITGWAQIHGANDLSWEEKFELDVWYVDQVSARVDLQILGRTLLIALKALISNRPETLATEFTGTPESAPSEVDPGATGEQP